MQANYPNYVTIHSQKNNYNMKNIIFNMHVKTVIYVKMVISVIVGYIKVDHQLPDNYKKFSSLCSLSRL